MARSVEILLADADVLIDYCHADRTILRLVAHHIGPVRVLSEVLDEVEGLGRRECAPLGIEVVQLETSSMLRINTLPPSLSVADRLCVVACEEQGWTCVTNDRTLRRVCKEHDIELRWGLALMVELVARGALDATRAIRVAQAIQTSNPRHITAGLLARFRNAIAKARR